MPGSLGLQSLGRMRQGSTVGNGSQTTPGRWQGSLLTLGVGADVGNTATVQEAVARVERELGPIDVLVNNAGIDVIQPFVDSTEQTWERLVQINP